MRPSNFYNVVPFVNDILQFVKKEKTRRAKKAKKDQQNGKINHQQSFTGETFMKLFCATPPTSSPLPSPSSSSASSEAKPDTILVYTAPLIEKPPKKVRYLFTLLTYLKYNFSANFYCVNPASTINISNPCY